MSQDGVFAAHMWPWPDPLLKRDLMGRIVFVNAAFLQLYGGRVEDWQGNTVGGWPNPQNNAHPTRFETRVPSQTGERIYDWVEHIMADGTAIAIARDVTDIMTPSDPPPGINQPVQTTIDNNAPSADEQMPAREPETAVAYAQETAQHLPNSQNTAPSVSAAQDIINSHDALTTQPPVTSENEAIATAPKTSETSTLTPPEPELSPQLENIVVTEPAQAVDSAPEPPTERDHERRALPIENGDAVLGNNWRDAVIAKAVGATKTEDATSEPSAPNPTPQGDASGGKSTTDLRILLAEDNAINALLTRTLLEAEGCSVDVVEDGALAVEAMKNSSYDMIFMDMRMPNMDGLESTRKIRDLPNVPSDLPIVALTANAFDDDRNACFDSGMNDFMTKPVSAEELSEMVTRWALKGPEQKMAS